MMNEAQLDVITNRILGFGLFDKNSTPSARASSALAGDRTALRLIVKDVARAALAEAGSES